MIFIKPRSRKGLLFLGTMRRLNNKRKGESCECDRPHFTMRYRPEVWVFFVQSASCCVLCEWVRQNQPFLGNVLVLPKRPRIAAFEHLPSCNKKKLPNWKRIWKFNSRRFNNYNDRFRNKHWPQLNSNASGQTIVPVGMTLPQCRSIRPSDSVFVLVETGFMVDRRGMELIGILVRDGTTTDIVGGTAPNHSRFGGRCSGERSGDVGGRGIEHLKNSINPSNPGQRGHTRGSVQFQPLRVVLE